MSWSQDTLTLSFRPIRDTEGIPLQHWAKSKYVSANKAIEKTFTGTYFLYSQSEKRFLHVFPPPVLSLILLLLKSLALGYSRVILVTSLMPRSDVWGSHTDITSTADTPRYISAVLWMAHRPTHGSDGTYPDSRARATSFRPEPSRYGALPNDKAVTSAELSPHPAGPFYCSWLFPNKEKVQLLTLLKIWEGPGRP